MNNKTTKELRDNIDQLMMAIIKEAFEEIDEVHKNIVRKWRDQDMRHVDICNLTFSIFSSLLISWSVRLFPKEEADKIVNDLTEAIQRRAAIAACETNQPENQSETLN